MKSSLRIKLIVSYLMISLILIMSLLFFARSTINQEFENYVKENLECFDLQKSELSFDRNNSDGWSSGCSVSPLDLKDKALLDIHLFSDQSSVEVFSCRYQNNYSCNVFAGSSQNKNYIMAEGGTAVFKSILSWGFAASGMLPVRFPRCF